MHKLTFIVSLVVAFALGIYVGRMPIATSIFSGTPAATEAAQKTVDTPTNNSTEEKGTVVSTTNLSAGQQQLLSRLGLDASKTTVTPTMIAGAEAKLGATRRNEIVGGATPSFREGVSLLACYR